MVDVSRQSGVWSGAGREGRPGGRGRMSAGDGCAPSEGGRGKSAALKVGIPAVPRHYVRRSRLLGLLDVDAPVTLVVAPAGAGKTVLIGAWAGELGRPVAWLSPESSDVGA